LLFSAFASPTWTIKLIDRNAAEGSVLAVDAQNDLHVAYTDYENGVINNPQYVMYATLNGSSWNVENTNIPGQLIDFRLDANDQPHLLVKLFKLPAPGAVFGESIGLGYVTKTNLNWSIQLLDTQGLTGALALDSKGNPHIAYINYTESRSPPYQTPVSLKYATRTSDEWSFQTIDSDISNSSSLIFLALDSHDNANVMYQGGKETIKYAVLNESAWRIQTLLEDFVLNEMALNQNGSVSFLFSKNLTVPSNSLFYANWDGLTLSNKTVASNIRLGGGFAYFTLDSQNNPNIDYYNGTGGNSYGSLVYTKWTGYGWESQTVDSEFATGSGPIVLDSDGNPHISYSGLHDTIYYFAAHLMYAAAAPNTTSSPTQSTISPTPSAPTTATPTSTTGSGVADWILVGIITLVVIVAIVATIVFFVRKRKGSSVEY
jgi:hypothetical protein